jgi:hypothetical protein
MPYYAHITNGVVDNVIAADYDFITTLPDSDSWIPTSYNTTGGVHVDPITRQPDEGRAVGKNFAGTGCIWDGIGFTSPRPYMSWALDPSTYFWIPPTPMPDDGKNYLWDEPSLAWILQ